MMDNDKPYLALSAIGAACMSIANYASGRFGFYAIWAVLAIVYAVLFIIEDKKR